MARVLCDLPAFIRKRGITLHHLATAMRGRGRYHTILLLCEEVMPNTVDLRILGDAITSLRTLTGENVQLTDLLEFDPSDEAT